MIKANQLIT